MSETTIDEPDPVATAEQFARDQDDQLRLEHAWRMQRSRNRANHDRVGDLGAEHAHP
jgi:hypothetical protein